MNPTDTPGGGMPGSSDVPQAPQGMPGTQTPEPEPVGDVTPPPAPEPGQAPSMPGTPDTPQGDENQGGGMPPTDTPGM